jgi:hypothetical protein
MLLMIYWSVELYLSCGGVREPLPPGEVGRCRPGEGASPGILRVLKLEQATLTGRFPPTSPEGRGLWSTHWFKPA